MGPSVAESVRPDYGAQNTQVLGRRSSNGVLWTNVRRESDAVQRSRTPSASFLPHCVVILVGDVVDLARVGTHRGRRAAPRLKTAVPRRPDGGDGGAAARGGADRLPPLVANRRPFAGEGRLAGAPGGG